MTFPDAEVSKATLGHAIFGGALSARDRSFGIYARDGALLPDCDVVSSLLTTHPQADVDLAQDYVDVDSPVLFCGLAAQQYGHVLTSSIGRLWALEHLPKETVLYFLPQRRQFLKLYPNLRPVLASLGIKNEVLLTKEPHRLRQLHTAPELYGERFGGHGSPAFFDWLDRRWSTTGPVTQGRAVYVSRARLGPKVGRFACEEHLEGLLAAAGYEIYHPERHDLTHQVATFKDAGLLVFAESSALHLYALIRRPEQRAAVILRRKELPNLISQQLSARPGPAIAVIDAIKAEYWPPVRQDNLSVSALDFDRLRTGLIGAGLLRPTAPWTAPSPEVTQASLNAILDPGETLLTVVERRQFLKRLRAERRARRAAAT